MGRIDFAVPSITDDDVAAVESVMRSGWLTTGEQCSLLESELASYLGAPHVVAVSSCTAALEIAVAGLRLPPGALVVVPTWTFLSTALAAGRSGARPLIADVSPLDLNLSAAILEPILDTHPVAAVIPVHIAGVAVESEVFELCAERGVPVIEDAAHALGTRFDGPGPDAGSLVNGRRSVAACFSFYATKNLSCAEGGAISTFDPEMARFARSYRLHGMESDAWARYRPGARSTYDLVHAGIKANLPDMLAALARSQLQRFDDMQAARQRLVERYRSNLASVEGVDPLPRQAAPGSANHLMVITLPGGQSRQDVQRRLGDRGIGSSVHFRPLHTYPWFQENALFAGEGFPGADSIADRVLSLPLHPGLTDEDVDRVCDVVAEALA